MLDIDYYTDTERRIFEDFIAENTNSSLYIPDLNEGENIASSVNLALASFREHAKNSFVTSNASGERFRLYPAYYNDLKPNAFASYTEALNVCAVNVGMAATTYELAMFSFAQPNTFPDIGIASNENPMASVQGYPPGFWMSSRDGNLPTETFITEAQKFIPQDQTRRQAATILGLYMLRFVWFHELYHCLNGHTGYSQSRGFSLMLHEIAPLSFSGENSLKMQCMEFDADQSALYACCKVHLAGIENIDGMDQYPREFHLRMTLLAAYLTTWIIEEHALREGTEDPAHPDPYLRLHNLIRTLASSLYEIMPNAQQVSSKVFEDIAHLSKSIPRLPKASQILTDMKNPALQKKLDGFQEKIEVLRNELKPYQYLAV